jgi:hypothetical protein
MKNSRKQTDKEPTAELISKKQIANHKPKQICCNHRKEKVAQAFAGQPDLFKWD